MTIELAISYNRMRTVTSHDYDDYCHVCGRYTDHFGEHDELVELGLAAYGDEVQYFTNSDGRTVHALHYRSINRTDLFNTRWGQEARKVLYAAQGEQIDAEISGHVSLIKPIGAVITAAGRAA